MHIDIQSPGLTSQHIFSRGYSLSYAYSKKFFPTLSGCISIHVCCTMHTCLCTLGDWGVTIFLYGLEFFNVRGYMYCSIWIWVFSIRAGIFKHWTVYALSLLVLNFHFEHWWVYASLVFLYGLEFLNIEQYMHYLFWFWVFSIRAGIFRHWTVYALSLFDLRFHFEHWWVYTSLVFLYGLEFFDVWHTMHYLFSIHSGIPGIRTACTCM